MLDDVILHVSISKINSSSPLLGAPNTATLVIDMSSVTSAAVNSSTEAMLAAMGMKGNASYLAGMGKGKGKKGKGKGGGQGQGQ